MDNRLIYPLGCIGMALIIGAYIQACEVSENYKTASARMERKLGPMPWEKEQGK